MSALQFLLLSETWRLLARTRSIEARSVTQLYSQRKGDKAETVASELFCAFLRSPAMTKL